MPRMTVLAGLSLAATSVSAVEVDRGATLTPRGPAQRVPAAVPVYTG
jgi:hypothetical protein